MTTRINTHLLGAVFGIVIATTIYVAVDQSSFMNMKGYLISDPRIQDSAMDIVTNRPNTDVKNLALIERRVAAMGQKLAENAAEPEAPNTLLNQHARNRREERGSEQVTAVINATGTEYPGTQRLVSEYDRLALRNERIVKALQGAKTGAEIYQPNMQVISPGYKPFQAVTTPEPELNQTMKGKGAFKPVEAVQIPKPTVLQKTPVETPMNDTVTEQKQKDPVHVPTKKMNDTVRAPIQVPANIAVRRIPIHTPRSKNLADSGPLLESILWCAAILAVASQPRLRQRMVFALQGISSSL